MAKGLSAAKAKKILTDGYVKGKPLTAKQKKYFGAIASGATPLKAINGGWLDKYQDEGSVPKAQYGLPFGVKSQPFSDVYVPNIQWAENVQGLEWAKDKQQGMNVSGVNLSKDFNLGKNTSLSVSNPAFVHAKPMVDGTQFGEANKFFPLDPKVTLRYTFNEGGSLPKAQGGKTLKWFKDMYNAAKGVDAVKIINNSGLDISNLGGTSKEIAAVAKKIKDRLMTDKFITNNMNATGRTRQQVIESIENFTSEFNKGSITFDDIGDYADGIYKGNGNIGINTNNLNFKVSDDILGTVDHEVNHLFSDSKGSYLIADNKLQGQPLYDNYPSLEITTDPSANLPGGSLYQSVAPEQQVRQRKAIAWLEENAGLEMGGDITEEMVEKLGIGLKEGEIKFARRNTNGKWTAPPEEGGKYKYEFLEGDYRSGVEGGGKLQKGKYSDVGELLNNIANKAGSTVLTTPVGSKNWVKAVTNTLNKTYGVIPAAGAIGAVSQMGPKQEDGQFKNGGWLDKYQMGGSLPGASGMMYSRTSGSPLIEPGKLKKAQTGVEGLTPQDNENNYEFNVGPIYDTLQSFYEKNKDLKTTRTSKQSWRGDYDDDTVNLLRKDSSGNIKFNFCEGEQCAARANRVVNAFSNVGSPYFTPSDETKNEFGMGFSTSYPPTEQQIKENPHFINDTNFGSADSWDYMDAAKKTNPSNVLFSYFDEIGKATEKIDYKNRNEYYAKKDDWKKYNIPMGSYIFGGVKDFTVRESTPEKEGAHTARVVGYLESGEPLIADYGDIVPFSEFMESRPITGIVSVPGKEQHTFERFKKLNEDANKKSDSNYWSENIPEDAGSDYVEYHRGIVETQNYMQSALNISPEKYERYAKIAMTIPAKESDYGRGKVYNYTDWMGESTGPSQLNMKNVSDKYLKTLKEIENKYGKNTPEYEGAATILYIKELDNYTKNWAKKGETSQTRPYKRREWGAKEMARETLQGQNPTGYFTNTVESGLSDTFVYDKPIPNSDKTTREKLRLPYKQIWQDEESYTKEVNEMLPQGLSFKFQDGERVIEKDTKGNEIPNTLEDNIFYSWQSPNTLIYGDAQGDSTYYKGLKNAYQEMYGDAPKQKYGGSTPKSQGGWLDKYEDGGSVPKAQGGIIKLAKNLLKTPTLALPPRKGYGNANLDQVINTTANTLRNKGVVTDAYDVAEAIGHNVDNSGIPKNVYRGVKIPIDDAGLSQLSSKRSMVYRDVRPENIMTNNEGMLKMQEYAVGQNLKRLQGIDKNVIGNSDFLHSGAWTSNKQGAMEYGNTGKGIFDDPIFPGELQIRRKIYQEAGDYPQGMLQEFLVNKDKPLFGVDRQAMDNIADLISKKLNKPVNEITLKESEEALRSFGIDYFKGSGFRNVPEYHFMPGKIKATNSKFIFKEGGTIPKAQTGNFGGVNTDIRTTSGESAYDDTVYPDDPNYDAKYRETYEGGAFASMPNQLDEVVLNSGVDYEKYPLYDDLSEQDRQYFKDDGAIGRGVRRRAQTKKGLAEDTYDVVNPLMYGMLGVAGGMMAGPSIANLTRAAAPYVVSTARTIANSPVGVGIRKALNYKPMGGPASVGNIMDIGFADMALRDTPEMYDAFKENPNWDTGTDLALTASDLIPYGEIATGFKGTRRLINSAANKFNDLTSLTPDFTPIERVVENYIPPVTQDFSKADLDNVDLQEYAKAFFTRKEELQRPIIKKIQNKEIKSSEWSKLEEDVEQQLLKEFNLNSETLGRGAFASVYSSAFNPKRAIKLGHPMSNFSEWTPELMESLKSLRTQTDNLAIPKSSAYFEMPNEYEHLGYKPTKHEALLMDNLNLKPNIARDKISKRDRYALFLKQSRQLKEQGIELDAVNLQNFSYNKNKNVFDLYDLNPTKSNEGFNSKYLEYIKRQTTNKLFDNAPLKNGGVIKDDMGQWAHPGEVTEISGNTMATHGYGDNPLYVVPDVGEPRMVQANTGTQTFPGATKFTEYPMAKNGSLVELNQLTNFTNYNTPQPGGWLDKYN